MPSNFSTVPLPPATTRLRRLPLQWAAYREARALDADLYHIHDPELIPVAFFLRRTTGASIIYDMHEDYRGRGGVSGRLLRRLERWCFSWTDHVVTAEKRYESILADESVSFTFVGNYYKPYERAASSSGSRLNSPPPWTLLYTGSIAGHRGLFTMLTLASRLRERESSDSIQLVGICRRPKERRRADERIQAHGLGDILDRVGWTEYVPPADMVQYYLRADVGLALIESTPDHAKSLPTKFFEYLHFGLPIISTDIPLWQSFIERHECGEVVPSGDADAVLEVLDRWADHPEEYQARARAARQAASQYRWEPMGKRLVGLYDRLLQNKRRR